MTRIARAWSAMSREQRLAVLAAIGLLVTMFFPWYGLQSLNRRSGAIYSHDINAFGDVSFVEAAIFLVAAGVVAMLLGRAEQRDFSLPGGDGTIVTLAGGWATLLIFYRVFDRPAGHGYPVGIEWGFFLAFVASVSLAYAGWRIRHGERPEPPVLRARAPRPPGGAPVAPAGGAAPARDAAPAAPAARAPSRPVPARAPAIEAARGEQTAETELVPLAATRADANTERTRPAPARPARRDRPRHPPAPGEPEQLSFDDAAGGRE